MGEEKGPVAFSHSSMSACCLPTYLELTCAITWRHSQVLAVFLLPQQLAQPLGHYILVTEGSGTPIAGRPRSLVAPHTPAPPSSVTLGKCLCCFEAHLFMTAKSTSRNRSQLSGLSTLLLLAGPFPSPSCPIHLYLQRARSVMSGWGKMGTFCLRGRRGPWYPGSSSSTAVSSRER